MGKYYDDYLFHSGIKGMTWHNKKANPNATESQAAKEAANYMRSIKGPKLAKMINAKRSAYKNAKDLADSTAVEAEKARAIAAKTRSPADVAKYEKLAAKQKATAVAANRAKVVMDFVDKYAPPELAVRTPKASKNSSTPNKSTKKEVSKTPSRGGGGGGGKQYAV